MSLLVCGTPVKGVEKKRQQEHDGKADDKVEKPGHPFVVDAFLHRGRYRFCDYGNHKKEQKYFQPVWHYNII